MSSIGELRTLARSRRSGPQAKTEHTEHKDNRVAYLFLLPWLLGVVCITIGPMLASLYLSFTDYNLLQPPKLTGLENYTRMFGDHGFCTSLKVTLHYVFVSVPLQLVLALALAVLLDRGMRGLAFYRSVLYLPSLLGARWRSPCCGGRCSAPTAWSTSSWACSASTARAGSPTPSTALCTIILLHVWTFGSPMVIFLAGLRQIPRMYYEAARSTGRRHVAPVPVDHAAVAVADHLLQPGAADHRRVPVLHPGLRRLRRDRRPERLDAVLHAVPLPDGLRQFQMGYASAMAWVLLVIVAALHRHQLLSLEILGVLR